MRKNLFVFVLAFFVMVSMAMAQDASGSAQTSDQGASAQGQATTGDQGAAAEGQATTGDQAGDTDVDVDVNTETADQGETGGAADDNAAEDAALPQTASPLPLLLILGASGLAGGIAARRK